MPARSACCLALILAVAACAPGAEDAVARTAPTPVSALAPSLAPEDAGGAVADPTAPATASTATGAPSPDPPSASPALPPDGADGTPPAASSPDGPAASPTASAPDESPATATTSQVADAAGDVTSPGVPPPPTWIDLRAATLTVGPVVELRVRLGDTVPARQEDAATTGNVAWFADLDGDGAIDLEVWANLADDGWYPGVRDDRRHEARFGEDTGVTIRPDSTELVITIPSSLLDGADTFRWALASEWGRYEQLGTEVAARDHAPDNGAVRHPVADGSGTSMGAGSSQ